MQEPVARANFLGLPPELRNSIYKILLTSADPLEIAIPTPMYTQYKCQPSIGVIRPPGTNGLIRGINFLRVSRLTYQEARAILYGHNIFLFMEPQALRIFAFSVGDNKAKLRHVQVQIGRATTTRAALKAVHPTPNLRNLDLGRMLQDTEPHRITMRIYGDEGLHNALVAFADAGLTVDECEERFATTRLCAITEGSSK